MKRLVTLSVACSIAFAACAHTVAPSFVPSASANDAFRLAQVPASSLRTLYNFDDASGGGINPYAALIDVKGLLYGTTHGGGSSSACAGGCGTAYSLRPLGHQNQIYDFGSYSGDGTYPVSELLDVNGTFYGTTRQGGSSKACSGGCGTIFTLDKAGNEQVIYSFGSYKGDGTAPHAGLIEVAGTLYGTTETGGSKNQGAVFSISTTGQERVFYTFGSYKGDGRNPVSELTNVHGVLYGTTLKGGSHNVGTVFKVERKSGNEAVLHSFGGAKDGALPAAHLVFIQGSLYGTTASGGTLDGGTVFIVSTTGIEGILHSFGKRGDGKEPLASLTNAPGTFLTFYGTTAHGGAHGDGTIYSITGSGAEKPLVSFAGSNGAAPYSRVLRLGSRFYGTTAAGGSGKCSGLLGTGCGTAYAFTP